MSAKAKKSPPTPATITNSDQTTSNPAPRGGQANRRERPAQFRAKLRVD
jgi:hypothetical protein